MEKNEKYTDAVIEGILRKGDEFVKIWEEKRMMKLKDRIFVIKGDPNVGKTTASKILLTVLLYNGATLISYRSLGSDFIAVVQYLELRIAICSMGDVLGKVEENIKIHIECDIVVVTSRNYASFDKRIGVFQPRIYPKVLTDCAGIMDYVKQIYNDINAIAKP